jgi:hypothetical protein
VLKGFDSLSAHFPLADTEGLSVLEIIGAVIGGACLGVAIIGLVAAVIVAEIDKRVS